MQMRNKIMSIINEVKYNYQEMCEVIRWNKPKSER